MISKAKDFPKTAFRSLRKMMCAKSYGFAPHSLAIAVIFQDFSDKYIRPKVEFPEVVLDIFTESVIRDISLSGIIFFLGLSTYIIIFTFDFITGTKASKKEYKEINGTHKGYFDSEKAWSSIWKMSAVIMVSSIMLIFSISFALIEQGRLHTGGLIIMMFFLFMATSFDVHSIGENQKRRFGQKPEFFNTLEDYFEFVGNLMMLRVKSIFNAGSVSHEKIFKKKQDEK